MLNRLETHSVYKGVNEDQQCIIMNGCEKHITAKLFKKYQSMRFVLLVFYTMILGLLVQLPLMMLVGIQFLPIA